MSRQAAVPVVAVLSGLLGAGLVALSGFAGAYVFWLLSALLPVPPYLLSRRYRVAAGLAPNVVMACTVPLIWLAGGPAEGGEVLGSWLVALGTAAGIGLLAVVLLSLFTRWRGRNTAEPSAGADR